MVPTVAFPRGAVSKAACVPRGQPQLETSHSSPLAASPSRSRSERLRAPNARGGRTAPPRRARARCRSRRARAASRALLGHEDEAERRVEDPGRELAEEADLELEAARREELVAEDEREVAARGRRAPRRAAGVPSPSMRTTAVPIMSRSASGSATLPNARLRRASAARGSRRSGRSAAAAAKKTPAPHAGPSPASR